MIRLAVRNLLRHRLRSAMALAAIVVGVAGLILSGGFVHDIVVQLGEALIHSQTGHAQVSRRGYFDAGMRRPEQFLIGQPQPLRRQLADATAAGDVLMRIGFSGLLGNGRADLPVVGEGVEPDREASLGTHLRIVAGRPLSGGDRHGIAVGAGVARALKLSPGDAVTLLVGTAGGALNTLDAEVVGVFQSYARDFDARAVRIPLAAAQELLDTDGVNTMVLSLPRTDATADAVAALRQTLDPDLYEVKAWHELSDFYGKTVDLYRRQFGVLRVIVLALVLLAVANSIGAAVMERMGEFGTMMAIGNRPTHAFRLVVLENLLLGLTGGALGVAAGVCLAAVISVIGIPMPPPPNADVGFTARIRIVPAEVAAAFVVGLIAAVAASIAPAWRITRTPIVDALRRNV